MAEATAPPEPDAVDGAPHPRNTLSLIGQDAAQAEMLDAFTRGQMHHAWLLTGPRGVGKATLAWTIARFLIAQPPPGGMFAGDPPTTLALPPDHPVAHRTRALSDPDLLLLRRAYDEKADKLKTVITVDEVRRLNAFFALSSAEGGRRVVIVDSADDMNPQAANALLKRLEEPPANATLLLISHAPSRLLPTIRSRCRTLRLSPLLPADMARALTAAGETPDDPVALAELAAGSVGEAVRLLRLGGLAIYGNLLRLLDTAPNMDRPALLTLAGTMTGAAKADRFDMTLRLIDRLLARLARSGAGLPPLADIVRGESAILSRHSPDPWAARIWADVQQTLSARAAHGRAVNLDPSALILDMGLTINQTAARIAAG